MGRVRAVQITSSIMRMISDVSPHYHYHYHYHHQYHYLADREAMNKIDIMYPRSKYQTQHKIAE